MITRRHLRRAALWSAAALGAAALLAYTLSLSHNVFFDGGGRLVFFGRGAFVVQWGFPPPSGATGPSTLPRGWHIERAGARAWRWLPRWIDPAASPAGREPGIFVVPYWAPLLIGLAAAYFTFPAGAPPRTKPRCPTCNFDLSAAPPVDLRRVHVRCPECGAITEREDAAPRPMPT